MPSLQRLNQLVCTSFSLPWTSLHLDFNISHWYSRTHMCQVQVTVTNQCPGCTTTLSSGTRWIGIPQQLLSYGRSKKWSINGWMTTICGGYLWVVMTCCDTTWNCYDRSFSSTYSFFDFPTPFPFTTGRGTHCFCSPITLDFHLHRSVLLCRLRSSPYSSLLSPSLSFYNDVSL